MALSATFGLSACASGTTIEEAGAAPLLAEVTAEGFSENLTAPDMVADGSIGETPESIDELVKMSDLAVLGTVGPAQKGWHFELSPTRGLYDRNSVLRVERVLFGNAEVDSTIVVRQQGIHDDGLGSQVEFDPWLREDQRVVVFLDEAEGNGAKPDGRSVSDGRGVLYDLAAPMATMVEIDGTLSALFPENPTGQLCGTQAESLALSDFGPANEGTKSCSEVPDSFKLSRLVRVNFGTEGRPREVVVDLDLVGDATEINIGTSENPEIVPFDARKFRDSGHR